MGLLCHESAERPDGLRPSCSYCRRLCCLVARRRLHRRPKSPCRLSVPKQGPIAEHIPADAILTPLAQAAIAPKISAPVKKFYVQRGAHVKEGQLLATLESGDLAAAALDNKGATKLLKPRTRRRRRRKCQRIRRKRNWTSRRPRRISN